MTAAWSDPQTAKKRKPMKWPEGDSSVNFWVGFQCHFGIFVKSSVEKLLELSKVDRHVADVINGGVSPAKNQD